MKDRVRTVDSIKTILSLIDVADVTGEDIREALDSGWKDLRIVSRTGLQCITMPAISLPGI